MNVNISEIEKEVRNRERIIQILDSRIFDEWGDLLDNKESLFNASNVLNFDFQAFITESKKKIVIKGE